MEIIFEILLSFCEQNTPGSDLVNQSSVCCDSDFSLSSNIKALQKAPHTMNAHLCDRHERCLLSVTHNLDATH